MKVRPEVIRKPRNLVLAYLSELAGPLLKLAVLGLGSRVRPPSEWRRAVIVGADHIGDVLYRTASLPPLAAAFPRCEWHYIAKPPGLDVVKGNPNLAGTHATLEEAIATGPFDAVICLNGGIYLNHLLKAVRLRIPNRAFCDDKGFSALVTHPLKYRLHQSFAGGIRDMVAGLTGAEPTWSLRPQIFPAQEECGMAQQYLATLSTQDGLGSVPTLACFVTTRQPSGAWPAENFGRSLQLLQNHLKLRLLLCGASGDAQVLHELQAKFSLHAHIIAGALPIRPMTALLRLCQAVLCLDSGPRHMANAMGVPVFFTRNISNRKVETGAYLETETDLCGDDELVPPELQSPVFAKLLPETVAARLVDFFEGTPTTPVQALPPATPPPPGGR